MKTTKNYTTLLPNATAVNILRSWLTAVGISHQPAKAPGFDLSVSAKDGGVVMVQVTKTEGESLQEGGVRVFAKDFTGKQTSTALAAFYQITDAAGHERRQPIDRGAEPAKNERGNPRKLHYRDEEFLVSIRHTEFRRSPNPTEDRWSKYRSTMEKTAGQFIRNNYELCQRNGVLTEDVLTYARCYVVSFCSRYEIPEETTTFCDNERKCYKYIQQRLNSDLRTVLLKKERSMLPDVETVSISLFGRPDVDMEISPDEAVEDEVDYDYIAKHCQLDTSSIGARKASAAAKLQELLANMPHAQMIEVLTNASKSVYFDTTTRREAIRHLKEHSKDCDVCAMPVAQ